jgi:hypothetical protein
MALSMFRSGRDVIAFTTKEDGSNLTPLKGRPQWKRERAVLVASGKPVPYGINADEIIAAVKSNGYSLHKIAVKISITEIENSPPPSAR